MVKDAVQAAVHLASGLTKTTRDRAAAAARALIGHAGLEDVAAEAQDRVTRLTEEIVSASRANAHLLTGFVTNEVDQAVERLGLARRSDLDDLKTEIAGLRTALASLATQSGGPESAEPTSPARKTAGTRKSATTTRTLKPAKAALAPSAKAATAAPAKRPATRKTAARKTTASMTGAGSATIADPAVEDITARKPVVTDGAVGPLEAEPTPAPAVTPDEGLGGARPEDAS